MDEELVALLSRLGDEENPLSDEELAQLQERVASIAASVDPAAATDEDIAMLSEARDAAVTIREAIATREAAAAERSAAAEALLSEITPAVDPEPADPAVDPAEPAAPAAVDPAAPTAVDPPEPAADPADPAPDPAVAASGAPPRRLPSISRLASRSPRSHRPQPTATRNGAATAVLTASADLPGLAPGQEVDVEDWARGSMRRYEALRQVTSTQGDGEKVYFGTIHREFPSERFLTDNENENEEKIKGVTSLPALAASGGVCAPVAVDYSVMGISQSSRPARDSAAQFGASRGGLRYILPHTLAQVTADGPASVWTEANDVALNNPAVKPHAVFSCQDVQEKLVDAVTSITQFGNFQSRYFPEQIAQYLEEVDAVHARLAEATILKAMYDGATARVTAGLDLLGATSEVLATIDRAAAAQRYRHRMLPEAPLRVWYPEWLEDMIRTDLARRLPGDSGGQAERLAVADAQIDNFFAVRNINVTNTQDSPTAASTFQGFLAQGDGLLNPWPSHVIMHMAPEGSWMFLDGGELNLGMVRDSTLNRTNDYQMFSETFEKMIFRGHESLAITLEVCPNGSTAATVDVSALCTSGS